MVIYFESERESVSGGGSGREEEKILSRLHAELHMGLNPRNHEIMT